MQFITDYKIEDYILNTKWDDNPADVQEKALCCSVDLMGALIGIDLPTYNYEMFFSRRTILTQEYMGLDENGKDNVVFPLDKPCNEGNVGPNSIQHRYFTEDIPVGCKIYHDLGLKFGVPTPIIDSMITLGGAMHEKSFFEETNYNLDYIDIGNMDKEQLLKYLYTGVLPS